MKGNDIQLSGAHLSLKPKYVNIGYIVLHVTRRTCCVGTYMPRIKEGDISILLST